MLSEAATSDGGSIFGKDSLGLILGPSQRTGWDEEKLGETGGRLSPEELTG